VTQAPDWPGGPHTPPTRAACRELPDFIEIIGHADTPDIDVAVDYKDVVGLPICIIPADAPEAVIRVAELEGEYVRFVLTAMLDSPTGWVRLIPVKPADASYARVSG
jgi:hypothetical protein